MVRIIATAAFAFTAMVAHGGACANPDPEIWLGEAEAAYDSVTSYTAVFHKQQRVAGKLLPEEAILLKCRRQPFSLYMKWIRGPDEGSELLYVSGWNGNRIRAHRGGLLRFITRNLDPGDPGLMAGNLRPATSAGIDYLLEIVGRNIRKAVKVGELSFSELPEEVAYGRITRVLEIVFAREKARDYEGYRFVISQDVESRIPIRIRIYEPDDRLVEDYGYENLDLNASLGDADFDPKNPQYHF